MYNKIVKTQDKSVEANWRWNVKYTCPQEMPYNISLAAKEAWNRFVSETKSGNPRAAIAAYHKYCLAKEAAFNKFQQNEMEL